MYSYETETPASSQKIRWIDGASKKYFVILASLILVVVIAELFIQSTRQAPGQFKNNSIQAAVNAQGDGRIEILPARKTLSINREFFFPLFDSNGKEVGKIKYFIENAELRDEIIVKGQKATAIRGRTFLIINFKLINDSNKAVQINSRDFSRLVANGNEGDRLAADIHNDPVDVQPASTKQARIGFPINDDDKNIKLQVGEISKEKTTIDLNF